MFWGAVGFNDRKMLDKCPARIKSLHHVKTLDTFNLKLNVPGFIFQQDNAPVHKAHVVQDYFRRHGWNVKEWPPCSRLEYH